MLHGMGIETGLDLERLVEAARPRRASSAELFPARFTRRASAACEPEPVGVARLRIPADGFQVPF